MNELHRTTRKPVLHPESYKYVEYSPLFPDLAGSNDLAPGGAIELPLLLKQFCTKQ